MISREKGIKIIEDQYIESVRKIARQTSKRMSEMVRMALRSPNEYTMSVDPLVSVDSSPRKAMDGSPSMDKDDTINECP